MEEIESYTYKIGDYMQSNIPRFTEEQLQWLNKTFPENTNMPSEASELYQRLGQRQVIKRIEAEIELAKRQVTK